MCRVGPWLPPTWQSSWLICRGQSLYTLDNQSTRLVDWVQPVQKDWYHDKTQVHLTTMTEPFQWFEIHSDWIIHSEEEIARIKIAIQWHDINCPLHVMAALSQKNPKMANNVECTCHQLLLPVKPELILAGSQNMQSSSLRGDSSYLWVLVHALGSISGKEWLNFLSYLFQMWCNTGIIWTRC